MPLIPIPLALPVHVYMCIYEHTHRYIKTISKRYFPEFYNNFTYNLEGPSFLATGVATSILILSIGFILPKSTIVSRIYTYISEIFLASIFAFALALSNMSKPSATLAFLDVSYPWYPILPLVLVGAVLVAAPAFYTINRYFTVPVQADHFIRPIQNAFDIYDWKLIIGELVFVTIYACIHVYSHVHIHVIYISYTCYIQYVYISYTHKCVHVLRTAYTCYVHVMYTKYTYHIHIYSIYTYHVHNIYTLYYI